MKYKYGTKELIDILNDVRLCTLLYITKNGKVFSSKAEEYLRWINEYSKYCVSGMEDAWQEDIRRILYNPLILKPEYKDSDKGLELIKNNNGVIIDKLFDYMNAGMIMDEFARTQSWGEVQKVLDEQGHTGFTMSGLESVLIMYALIGNEFIDQFDKDRVRRDANFRSIYQKRLKK